MPLNSWLSERRCFSPYLRTDNQEFLEHRYIPLRGHLFAFYLSVEHYESSTLAIEHARKQVCGTIGPIPGRQNCTGRAIHLIIRFSDDGGILIHSLFLNQKKFAQFPQFQLNSISICV